MLLFDSTRNRMPKKLFDILFPDLAGATSLENASPEALEFIEKLEKATNIPVTIIGTGPEEVAIIDLRKEKGIIV